MTDSQQRGLLMPIAARQDEAWAPVIRFGTVLSASSRVQANEAYELGEIAYSEPERVLAPFFSNGIKRQLRGLGISSILPAQTHGGMDSVGYQIKPTIILSYTPILFEGPMQFGRTRSANFECRMSLTICPDNTKSKLWLQFNPSEHLSIDGCKHFFRSMTEFEEILRDAVLSNYNTTIAKRIKKEFKPYFRIPIAVCASLDPTVGRIIGKRCSMTALQ